ncbi:hypothetical protein JYG30_21810 [Fibrella sp. USSR17]
MKTACSLAIALALNCLQHLVAQPVQQGRQSPTLYFVLTDSTIVYGRLVRQDSSMVVVRKRDGNLTYLEPYQIVRQTTTRPGQASQPGNAITSFSLKDGSTVYGRVVRQTPVAVVVRQANGTQTYIDPTDILSTGTVAASTDLPSLPLTKQNVPVADDPGAIPYLMGNQTTFTPGAGTLYYRNTYLIRNELEAGITNWWSVGVIVNPLFNNLYQTSRLFSEAIYTNTNFGTQLYSRVAIPLGRKVRLGAGLIAQLQYPSFADQLKSAFLGRVTTTFGDQRNNITLGYTFGIDSDLSYQQDEGWLAIGAMQSLSPSLTFISDNSVRVRSSIYGSTLARMSAALRIHRRYHAFDLGLLTALDQVYTYGGIYNYNYARFKAYPYVSYTVQFGKRRG